MTSVAQRRKIVVCPLTPPSAGRIFPIMRNWSTMSAGQNSSSCIVPAVAAKSR